MTMWLLGYARRKTHLWKYGNLNLGRVLGPRVEDAQLVAIDGHKNLELIAAHARRVSCG